MTTRNLLRIAIAVGVLAYFGYGLLKPKNEPTRATLAAPIAADAKEFTLGKLDFKSCELRQKRSGATTTAFCTPFSVAENRDAPDGRKINLRVALIRSDAATADSDIVVFLAGGPGQAAVDTWPGIAAAFAPLRKHHHVLLVDQRGTGESNPLTCKPGAEDDAQDTSERDAFNADQVRERMRECLTEVSKKADPRYYTTTIAAADLEAIRVALGSPQFDLVGVSYGTRMAQQYLVRYPDGVRSVVLDSVAPNELILGEDFAQNLEDSLKVQFGACKATPSCAKAFGDPYESLQKLRDQLRAQPQTYTYRDPVTFTSTNRRLNVYSLGGLVRMFAYTPETSAILPLSIAEGLRGDFAPLAGQADLLRGDMSDLAESGMQMSVICSEDADLLTPRPQDAGLLLGTLLADSIRTSCEVWPHGTRPADFHDPLKSDKPILVLEGELDPVTPPRYGEQVMKGLGNARLLIAKGQGHNVIGRGCMPKVANDFVEQLKPKDLDAKCLDVLGPMPAYVDFNGAAP